METRGRNLTFALKLIAIWSAVQTILFTTDEAPSLTCYEPLVLFRTGPRTTIARVMMEHDTKPVHEQRFDAAVKVIQSLPTNGSFQPSNEMMLKFYSYYKQATLGPCSIPRPGFWDPVGKAKWDAWHSLGDMPKEEAMAAYVDDLKLILESMPMTEEVEQLLQILGPFYELVDEKKKISEVSDLTTGFGNMIAAPSKSVTKSIIRTMQMNGTLDSQPTRKADTLRNNVKEIKAQEDRGGEDKEEQEDDSDDDDEEDDEDEENEEEESEQVKKAPAPKKKASSNGKAKGLPNGSIGHKVEAMTNGTHSMKSALNGKHLEEEEENDDGVTQETVIQHVNGCTRDTDDDASSLHHVASDSDGEVYCDSVDQFGVEEQSSEAHVNSLEESHPTLSSPREDILGAQDSVQNGGEDGKTSGGGTQRQRLSVDRPGSSVVRRGRGSKSPGSGSGALGSLQGGGGDGERWGTDGAVGGDLNEQIVTALARLQEDMQSVLERLHTLEALTASQARSAALPSEYLYPPAKKTQKKPSWWPFDISPGTVAFAIVWPFVVQWLIRLYFQRRRRKIN
ncbi:hypothetical protein NFI96_017967 [Prochilodus magdalenae]|nr:hypothetical protein NFI96_017967 [Prochilodus magdalenae]